MGKWKLRAKEFSRICDAYSAAFDEIQDLVCEPDERQFGVRHTIDLLRSRMIELQQLRVLRLRQNAEDWGEVAGSVLGPMLGPMITEPEEERGIAVDEVCQICGAKDCLAGDPGHYRPDGGWCYGVNTEPEERTPCVTLQADDVAEAWKEIGRIWSRFDNAVPEPEERVCSGRPGDICWMRQCQYRHFDIPGHTHPCGVMS